MAAEPQVKPGILGGLYRNTGTWGTPVWVEVLKARSVTPNFNWDTIEASIRATRAKLYAKTQIDMTVTAEVRADPADAAYVALFDAAMSPDGYVELLILDGKLTTEGSHGMRGEFLVNLPSQPQEIDGVIYDSFEVKPAANAEHFPQLVTVGDESAISMVAV